jgi:multidrug resistance efflux pump
MLSKVEEALSEKPPNRAREVEDLRAQVAKLQAEVKRQAAELEQARVMLSRQQDLTWLDDSAQVLQVNARLVAALKDHRPIHEARLLEILGVDASDLAMIGAISAQLELLEGHGRIKKGARGWRWV